MPCQVKKAAIQSLTIFLGGVPSRLNDGKQEQEKWQESEATLHVLLALACSDYFRMYCLLYKSKVISHTCIQRRLLFLKLESER